MSNMVAGLHSKLGDTAELLRISRKGIGYQLFTEIMKSNPYNLKEWSDILHVTERTLQRYRKESKTFDPLQSERIIEIVKLQSKGIDVFGSKEKFDTWMNTESIALGGERPKDLLDSSFGIDLIMDELGRIDHGILA